MTTPQARASRIEHARDLVELAQSQLWREVADQCRNGHIEEVTAVLGMTRSSVYRRIREWRLSQGIEGDGRSLRSSPF